MLWESRCILIFRGNSVLEIARKRHGNPKLRSADIEMDNLFVAVKDYHLEPGPTQNLIDFCMNHQLSMTNLLLLGIRTYLSKVNNGQEDITIQNFISRRSTHEEWTVWRKQDDYVSVQNGDLI